MEEKLDERMDSRTPTSSEWENGRCCPYSRTDSGSSRQAMQTCSGSQLYDGGEWAMTKTCLIGCCLTQRRCRYKKATFDGPENATSRNCAPGASMTPQDEY